MIESKRITFIERLDYRVDLEYTSSIVIVHLPYVKKFSPRVFRDMQHGLVGLRGFFKAMGIDRLYAAIPQDNETVIRLAERLGFEEVGVSDDLSLVLTLEI